MVRSKTATEVRGGIALRPTLLDVAMFSFSVSVMHSITVYSFKYEPSVRVKSHTNLEVGRITLPDIARPTTHPRCHSSIHTL
jgi:hypothetical protein